MWRWRVKFLRISFWSLLWPNLYLLLAINVWDHLTLFSAYCLINSPFHLNPCGDTSELKTKLMAMRGKCLT